MSVFTSANTAKTTSLNGMWDFCPCQPGDPMLVIPSDGWEEDALLVPSSWTGPGSEAFGYPAAWSRSRQGWLRRFIRVDRRGNRRAVLRFDGVGPRATVFLNGAAVGETVDAFTPFEVDITDVATSNVNELVVRILDTPRDEHGRAKHPAGSCGFAGIWQDVRILERAEVCVGNVAIRTSVRNGTITAQVEVCNASRRPRTVTVHNDVVVWKKTLKLATADAVLDLGSETIEVPARGSVTYTVEKPWAKPRLWSPESPQLHTLRFRLEEAGHALYVQGERFGFREVWAEGPNLYLNTAPLRLFSDNGPVPALHHGTEAWIRRWFELLRSTGLNHARLGGASASQLVRDVADEEGMLLTMESALDGSATPLATDTADFWVHGADHLRRLVLHDRNHPSIVVWSVSHNILGDLMNPSPAFRELPRLRTLVRELDPTRICYFDGDSVHWSAAGQELLDGRPGRFESIYDAPDHPRLATAFTGIAESARYIALARANGVAGVAVLSPNAELPRIPTQEIRLDHPDLDAPGLKLPVISVGMSGVDFWTVSKKSTLPPSDVLRAYADAFRPVAVIDITPATAVLEGQTVTRRVVVCNDSTGDLQGTLEATFRLRDAVFASQSFPVKVGRGERLLQEVLFDVPVGTPSGAARLDYVLVDGKGRKADQRRLPFRVAKPAECNKKLAGKAVAVVGSGALGGWFERIGLSVTQSADLSAPALAKTRLVVMEPHTIQPGSDQLAILREFVRKGGSVLLLEQSHTLFNGISILPRSSWLAVRQTPDHAVFAGLTDDDLVCWDNLPVAGTVYQTTDRGATLASGDGGALLLELQDGKGVVLATQLRFPPVLDAVPAAAQLLLNLLTYAATYRGTAENAAALEGDFTPVPAHEGKGYAETLWLRNAATSATLAAQLVAATVRANADFPPVQVFSVGDRWETVHRTNGWASAAASSVAAPIYLYNRLYAGVATSHLRLEGEGAVEVSVGGRTYAATLQEGVAVIADIVLQSGYNAVLILWKPAGPDSRLRPIWCDAQGNPQTAFRFM
jgi:hypothetical protein